MIQKKILILGSSGGLGKQLAKKFTESDFDVFLVNRKVIDVEKNFKKLKKLIYKIKSQYIINCIAKTGTNPCEEDQIQAFNINTLFPYKIAEVAKKTNSKLIHFSTDAIFQGNKFNKIYKENDFPHPITTYGQTKLYGEILIKKYINTLIIRLPILFGLTQKNQIIDRLVSKLFNGKTVKASSDVFSTPSHNIDITNFIFNLIKKNKFDLFTKKCNGIVHLSSGKYISLFDFMKIVGKITKTTKLIKSAKESDFKSQFVKPQYLGLRSNYQNNIKKIYNLDSKSKINEYINEISDTYYLS